MYPKSSEPWPRGKAPAQAFCGEDERLTVLAAHGERPLVDDRELQDIVDFAADLCATPGAMVTLVEAERQHFLVRTGVKEREAPRSTSFCAHAMLGAEPMIVADAAADPRFAGNPLVIGEPGIRFYAGYPLISAEGAPLGALCVVDFVPRPTGLSAIQRQGLAVLAEAVMRRLTQERLDRMALDAIARREARLKMMIDSVPGIAWSSDAAGNLDYVNARWTEATGAPVPESAAEWVDFIHPEDRDASLARWIEAMRRGRPHEEEVRMRQKDGTYRWVLSRALPAEEEEGGQRWFGTVIDVDRAKRLSESRDLLASELSHRIKNIFAVVAGIVTMRSRGRPEVEEFANEINAAIRSLGKAHDYVRAGPGLRRNSLRDLLGDLLEPYDMGKERIRYEGEDIAIGARAATPLALIFHELATNAAKYGALSHSDGRVRVAATRSPAECGEICLTWQESAAGFSGEPPSREEGFGSRLLRLAIEGQLKGRFRREFAEDGLTVAITLPAEKIAQ